MKDIFDTTILCKECKKEMRPKEIEEHGAILRIVECPECKEVIYHPGDVEKFKQFNNLKNKTFNVKLRIVGNSHAISIPKEIIDFMNQQERMMDDMVRLCFEDMRKLRLEFGGDHD